jgi:NAD(P)-dependent dehydrogenase (short-subunit alcohol dehydrogenase family)
MQFNWQNKTVIITGSGIGIGWQLAKELAQAGANVVLNARNKDRLVQRVTELTAQGYKATFYSGDISDIKICNALVEHCITTFGRLDVLINNAGLSAEAQTIEQLNPDVFTQLVQVNFLGAVYCTQAALPYIKKTKGHILFISSIAGLHGLGNYAAYCSSKMALTAFTESLRKELLHSNVFVGIAYLSFTENDPLKKIITNNGGNAPQPIRDARTVTPVKKVVKKLIYMIERRKSVVVFSSMGLVLSYINRLSPVLTHRLLLFLIQKNESQRKKDEYALFVQRD